MASERNDQGRASSTAALDEGWGDLLAEVDPQASIPGAIAPIQPVVPPAAASSSALPLLPATDVAKAVNPSSSSAATSSSPVRSSSPTPSSSDSSAASLSSASLGLAGSSGRFVIPSDPGSRLPPVPGVAAKLPPGDITDPVERNDFAHGVVDESSPRASTFDHVPDAETNEVEGKESTSASEKEATDGSEPAAGINDATATVEPPHDNPSEVVTAMAASGVSGAATVPDEAPGAERMIEPGAPIERVDDPSPERAGELPTPRVVGNASRSSTAPSPRAGKRAPRWPWLMGAGASLTIAALFVLSYGSNEDTRLQPESGESAAGAAVPSQDVRPVAVAGPVENVFEPPIAPAMVPEPAAAPDQDPPMAEPLAMAPEGEKTPSPDPKPAEKPEGAIPEPSPESPTPNPTAEGDLLAEARAALEGKQLLQAHDLADQAWKASRDNEAVAIMVRAACEASDGARARAAYRKLAGSARAELLGFCRDRGVDVRAIVDGYTAEELVGMARERFEHEDYAKAYELGRDSHRKQRSTEALEIMGMSACRMNDGRKAAYVARMLSPEPRQRLVEECSSQGVTIE